MSDTFGDWDEDDSFDTEPADPEQVARRLHNLRRREGFEITVWDRLDVVDRVALVRIATTLLGWLRRQGAHP